MLGFVGFFWIREKCALFVDFRHFYCSPPKVPLKWFLIKTNC
ncbi:hypothetical protein B4096_3191 [Heyndrickxia coagulans]|nr:hypothetical protein B4096_3191 [Heyndrickxia coagulans]